MDNNLVLKRFFSKNMVHDLLLGKEERLFNYVVRRYIKDPEGKSYETLISEIYSVMNKEYRTEYYYKNTMLNKLLFKNHDYRKTIALTELPVGNSKADFVMINGKGIVYEIKTELDNLERLGGQIHDYYKAFTNVYIVTYRENLERIENTVDNSVGIMVLTKRNALKTMRKPEEYKEKDVDVELCAIVNKIGKATGDFKFRFTEAVSMMACTMVYGDFSNISYAYRSFAKWLQENSQYKMKGSSRQIVHRGPWNEKNPENYLTEIQIPLENLL